MVPVPVPLVKKLRFLRFRFRFHNTGTQSRGGGGLDPRRAIEGSFSAWGGLGKPDRGLGRGETFFPDSGSNHGSNRDSDETFQISRNLGLEHVEFFCLLDSQPCFYLSRHCRRCHNLQYFAQYGYM